MIERFQQLGSWEQVEQDMQRFVDHHFLGQPFFQTLIRGQWDLGLLRYFAQQYAHYSVNFPRVLGAAISAMAADNKWWIPLADNLWDEAGRGITAQSHQALYRTFLESVDPSAPTWYPNRSEWPEMGHGVRQAIEGFISFFYQASPLEAMAAVGLGSEFFAGQIMGAIGRGLNHPAYQKTQGVDIAFWTIHAERDEPRHYALCRSVLLDYAPQSTYGRLLEVGQQIAATEAAMYAGIFQEAESKKL